MKNENRERRAYVEPVVEVIVFDPHEDIVCTSGGLTEDDGNGDIGGESWPSEPAHEVESRFDL